MSEPIPIQRHGVTFSHEGITSGAVHIPAASIDSIVLRRGLLSHHPVVQVLFGIMLLVAAGITIVPQFYWYRDDNTISLFFVFVSGCLLAMGAWTCWDATRHGWFCEVSTLPRGTRKVTLDNSAARSDMLSLCNELEMHLPWPVRVEPHT